jgi:hypothetical protein
MDDRVAFLAGKGLDERASAYAGSVRWSVGPW